MGKIYSYWNELSINVNHNDIYWFVSPSLLILVIINYLNYLEYIYCVLGSRIYIYTFIMSAECWLREQDGLIKWNLGIDWTLKMYR